MPGHAVKSAHYVIAKFFRKRFIALLTKLKHGKITLIDSLGKIELGDCASDLQCTIYMPDIRSYTLIALSGSNGCAQAYIDGRWSTDNLSELIRIFVRNRQVLLKMESGPAKIAHWAYRYWHAKNCNTRKGSRKNIAAHYDLGNEFFRLFLDERMMYSSALYNEGDDLQQASDRKLQRICDALKRVDYIKRYIFPGGFMPCYSVIGQFAAQNRLMMEDLHDMGLSYAQTLRDWRKRFYQHIETVSKQGYDTGFQRMWEFYLCYCEGAFDERATSVGQILLRKQAG